MNSAGWLVALLAVALAGVAVLLFFRAEGGAPSVIAPDALVVGTSGAAVTLSISDPGSGLRSLDVTLAHAGGEIPLLDETYPGNLLSGGVRSEQESEVSLDPAALKDVAGNAFLL